MAPATPISTSTGTIRSMLVVRVDQETSIRRPRAHRGMDKARQGAGPAKAWGHPSTGPALRLREGFHTPLMS
jgi:hypothetical protein